METEGREEGIMVVSSRVASGEGGLAVALLGGCVGFIAGIFSMALAAAACAALGKGLADNSRVFPRDGPAVASPASPLVIRVNSHIIPSASYDSCKGRKGRVYRARRAVLSVSAWVTMALKSFALIATCSVSSSMKSPNSFVS